MTQGPGGPPSFGPPPHQLPPPGPAGPPHQPNQPGPPRPRPTGDGPTGPARLLALGAAGAALVIYLLGFFANENGLLGTLSFSPLLVGGGLLAGASVLPKAGRVLLPGAIIALTGVLLLLQLVASGGAPGIVVFMLILGIVEAGAAIAAFLMDAGVVSAPARGSGGGPRQPQPQHPGYGPPPGYAPQGYGAPPGAYGPPSSPAMPPAFGAQQGGATPPPSQGGWGQGPGPIGGAHEAGARPDSDRTEPREDTSATSATTAIPIVTGGDRKPRPTDETNFFDDSAFGSTTTNRPAPEPPAESRSATAAMPAVGSDRPVDRGPADETSTYGGEGGMFAESTPRTLTPEPADDAGGGGRHEQPVDGERNERNGVPPNEQTWFMPPGDRPNPNQ
ncbi:DUF5336 domain-containing protein [Pseudonocardia humida]|uniref:DUF5336 domain-containing protein n=1 Tax=Pseudonocardia humida TaxID=2800819 RepID=A0ABT0ZVW6_9PSEU|nr:DUF5336 domain-containing protein [Pseudonocardia humida]MCO1654886.1 DUF5336 domain-containing protein [Pseudonocardia humida]